jgi:hypothetical protein
MRERSTVRMEDRSLTVAAQFRLRSLDSLSCPATDEEVVPVPLNILTAAVKYAAGSGREEKE